MRMKGTSMKLHKHAPKPGNRAARKRAERQAAGQNAGGGAPERGAPVAGTGRPKGTSGK